MRKIRVAQVGCNGVANAHAAAHEVTGNTQLVAVCDIIEDRACAFARKFNVPEFTTNAQELCSRDDIDLIDIVTSDAAHAPLAVMSANAGKNILIEKPLATSLKEADDIIAAVRTNDVKAMCAQSMRWIPKVSAFVDSIRSGIIGDIKYARFWGGCGPFWSPQSYPSDNPVYLLVHNGMHWMDLITWMLNEYPANVYTIGHPGQENVPLWEYFVVNMVFPSGAMCLAEDNRIIQPQGYPMVGQGIYVVGSRGTLALEPTRGLSVSLYNQNGMSFPGSHVYAAKQDDCFAGEISHIADCIIKNETPSITLEHSRKVLSGILAAVESFEKKMPIEVKYE